VQEEVGRQRGNHISEELNSFNLHRFTQPELAWLKIALQNTDTIKLPDGRVLRGDAILFAYLRNLALGERMDVRRLGLHQ
jgi:hypothetical protein